MLKIVCSIIIGLCVLASIALFPSYVGAAFPKKVSKSLRLKMTLSTLFITIAVASVVMMKNISTFAVLMLIGFAFAWLGDLLLGKGDATKLFLSGMSSFLLTHVFYITAMAFAAKHFFPDSSFFTPLGVAVGAVVTIFEILLCVVKKARFHKLFIPVAVYSSVLILMFAQSVSLGIRLLPVSRAAILLPLGAFFYAQKGILVPGNLFDILFYRPDFNRNVACCYCVLIPLFSTIQVFSAEYADVLALYIRL